MGIITLTHDDNDDGESCYHWGTRKIENRFWCNGIDLKWLSIHGRINEFITQLQQIMSDILTLPIPTIAIINGHATAKDALRVGIIDYILPNYDLNMTTTFITEGDGGHAVPIHNITGISYIYYLLSNNILQQQEQSIAHIIFVLLMQQQHQ
ncbi:hypothetical protein Pmar_PMAR003181 [Perkinsus marinus ATCC 50983]|uniref:Uncharacterized protein n=1 Tax=Perkinsus marinus (strain ATCC 50983 / TXsc) TaxID=423536 RepID=C5L1R6_PERM5|nr:hypothetical protein Pmar_PMAR003181 [Perkinsus marinus ATCC 50983]EER09333.1 hypothetical protein Pmar_PMAR003181 [Perkinsus marinus ATCC 50983]|eukprot:XP_002777517.1 hypothetical protein Pmar_PMAR003181 [Perkinsus marinus ATCC 50983]